MTGSIQEGLQLAPSAFVRECGHCSKAFQDTATLIQMISILRGDLGVLSNRESVDERDLQQVLEKYGQQSVENCKQHIQGILQQYVTSVDEIFRTNEAILASAMRTREAEFVATAQPPKITLDQRRTVLENRIAMLQQVQELLREIVQPEGEEEREGAVAPQVEPQREAAGSRWQRIGQLVASAGALATWGVQQAPGVIATAATEKTGIEMAAHFIGGAVALTPPVQAAVIAAIAAREVPSWNKYQYVAAAAGGLLAFGAAIAAAPVVTAATVGAGAALAAGRLGGRLVQGVSSTISQMTAPAFQEAVHVEMEQAALPAPVETEAEQAAAPARRMRPKLPSLGVKKFSRITRRFRVRGEPARVKQLDIDHMLESRLTAEWRKKHRFTKL